MESKLIKTFKDKKLYTDMQMPIIAIYYNPSDFPGKYVGRLFNMDRYTPYAVIKDSLEELRNEIPHTMVQLGRSPSDDPVIVETWL